MADVFQPNLSGRSSGAVPSAAVQQPAVLDLFTRAFPGRDKAAAAKAAQEDAESAATAEAYQYQAEMQEATLVGDKLAQLDAALTNPNLSKEEQAFLREQRTSYERLGGIADPFRQRVMITKKWREVASSRGFRDLSREAQAKVAEVYGQTFKQEKSDVQKALEAEAEKLALVSGGVVTPELTRRAAEGIAAKAEYEAGIAVGKLDATILNQKNSARVGATVSGVVSAMVLSYQRTGAVDDKLRADAMTVLAGERQLALDALNQKLGSDAQQGILYSPQEVQDMRATVNREFDSAIQYLQDKTLDKRLPELMNTIEGIKKLKYPLVMQLLQTQDVTKVPISAIINLAEANPQQFKNMTGLDSSEKNRRAILEQWQSYTESAKNGFIDDIPPGLDKNLATVFLRQYARAPENTEDKVDPGAEQQFSDLTQKDTRGRFYQFYSSIEGKKAPKTFGVGVVKTLNALDREYLQNPRGEVWVSDKGDVYVYMPTRKLGSAAGFMPQSELKEGSAIDKEATAEMKQLLRSAKNMGREAEVLKWLRDRGITKDENEARAEYQRVTDYRANKDQAKQEGQ